jgi:outer membrane protein with beta-barrel domain
MTSASTSNKRVRTPRIVVVMIAGALLTMAHNAAAQTAAAGAGPDTGQWSVTPLIGTAFSGDVDSPTVVFGVGAGYRWTPRVSLEAEFNVLPSSETSGVLELDTKVWNVTGNVLYHFAERPWRPFGAFGLGLGHGSANVNTTDPLLRLVDTSSTEFIVNFGGGVEHAIRDGIRFRGDLRYFFGGDLVADYWRLSAGVSFDVGRGR